MNQEYETIPVGTEGEYIVQRTAGGEVHYLAASFNAERIARFDAGLATLTCKMLRHNPATLQDAKWLPWHTAQLDTLKPMNLFTACKRPPVSPYDMLGRA